MERILFKFLRSTYKKILLLFSHLFFSHKTPISTRYFDLVIQYVISLNQTKRSKIITFFKHSILFKNVQYEFLLQSINGFLDKNIEFVKQTIIQLKDYTGLFYILKVIFKKMFKTKSISIFLREVL